MSSPILATKLYMRALPRKVLLRSHLLERLNAGLHPSARAYHATFIDAARRRVKMAMTTRWRFPAALLLIGSLLLSACAGRNETPATGAGVAPINTTAAAGPTDTTALREGAAV